MLEYIKVTWEHLKKLQNNHVLQSLIQVIRKYVNQLQTLVVMILQISGDVA